MTQTIGPVPLSADSDTDVYSQLLESVASRFQRLTTGSTGGALFSTDTTGLFDRFLAALPPEIRQEYTCGTCRKFFERYGGLVRVSDVGRLVPVMWDPDFKLAPFAEAVRSLVSAVSSARITGLFLSEEIRWGRPLTGKWPHFAVGPSRSFVFTPSAVMSVSQVIAEKRQDYQTLVAGLKAFPSELVAQARSLLTMESLYRSEKCLGVAEWLAKLHEDRQNAFDESARENLTWLAVAKAPPGFCHVRSTMIGSLLEDLGERLPFDQVKARFDAKMHPLQYQRPTAPPSAGNIARAEVILAKLKSAGSLERRFARLADIQAIWRPAPTARPEAPQMAPRNPEPQLGVFGHLKNMLKSPARTVEVPPLTMTWEKFARTVLPTAQQIEYFVPASDQSYMALVTAAHADSVPLLQWDSESRRNPVSSYLYVNGSAPSNWNLRANDFHPVTAVTLLPSMWYSPEKFTHQGAGVMFLLKNAFDKNYQQGGGLFVEQLKNEYHEIRSTLEAHIQQLKIAGKNEAEGCGISLQKGGTWSHRFRVQSPGGVMAVYLLDRWD